MWINFWPTTLYESADKVSALNVNNDPALIIKLGAFHMMQPFFGCIDNIMAGSGLNEVLSTVYTDKTCDQILSGHNYSIVVRAHSLVQLTLFKFIYEEIKNEEKFIEFQKDFKDFFIPSIKLK